MGPSRAVGAEAADQGLSNFIRLDSKLTIPQTEGSPGPFMPPFDADNAARLAGETGAHSLQGHPGLATADTSSSGDDSPASRAGAESAGATVRSLLDRRGQRHTPARTARSSMP